MKLLFVCALLLLWSVPLLAETYSWVDDNGTCNFTEDLSRVPKKYRKSVSRRGDMDGQPVDGHTSELDVKAKAAIPKKSNKTANQIETDDGLYNGKKPEAWQQEMRPLYSEVKQLEQQLVELESLIRNPVGISRSRVDGLPQEFREIQKRYNQALIQYNCLNDEANKVELPAEFRK